MKKEVYINKNYSHRRIDLAWNKNNRRTQQGVIKVNTVNLIKSKGSNQFETSNDTQTSILNKKFSSLHNKNNKNQSESDLQQCNIIKKRLNQSSQQQIIKINNNKIRNKFKPFEQYKNTQCLQEEIILKKNQSDKKLTTLTLKNIHYRYIQQIDNQDNHQNNSKQKSVKLQSQSSDQLILKKSIRQRFNLQNPKITQNMKKKKKTVSCLRLRESSQDAHYSTINSKKGAKIPQIETNNNNNNNNNNNDKDLKMKKQNKVCKNYLLPVKQDKHLNYMKLKQKIFENITQAQVQESTINEKNKQKHRMNEKQNSIEVENSSSQTNKHKQNEQQNNIKHNSNKDIIIPSLNCSTISQCRDSNESFFSKNSINYIKQICKDQTLPQIKKIIDQKDRKRKIDIEKLRKKFPNDFFKS